MASLMGMRALWYSLVLWQVLHHDQRQGHNTMIGTPSGKEAVSMGADTFNFTNATSHSSIVAGTREEEQSEFTRHRGDEFIPHSMRRRMMGGKGAQPSVRGLRKQKSVGLAIISVVRQDVFNAASSAAHFLLKLVTGNGWLSFWLALFWVSTTCLQHKSFGCFAPET